jgi:TfoX/Sxy family transcriptional regulator of competence genes
MACDEQLVERIRAVLADVRGVGERRMFGGVCFTINGNMACGVVKDDLMVRVGPDNYTGALKRPHARPMDFTGRPMKGYVFIAAPGIKSASSLKGWVGAAVTHVRTLPPKSPKGSDAERNRKASRYAGT